MEEVTRREAAAPARPFGPRGVTALIVLPLVLALVARSLGTFAAIIQPYLAVRYDWRFELGMVTGQVLFQWAFLWRRSWERRLSYAWILLAVSGLGGLLLLPVGALATSLTPATATLGFFAIVGFMFVVHWVLVARHGLPKWLCATWVLYRLLMLTVLVRWSALL